MSSSETGIRRLLVQSQHGLKLTYTPSNSCIPNLENCVKVQAHSYGEIILV